MRIKDSSPDATGRSSGKVTGRKGRNIKPPKGEPWVWHTRELLVSDAWKARSINCRRLLDFLEVEHMNHAGTENGNLMATHDQLNLWGAGRRHIRPAIEEAVFLGLLRTIRGGRWAGTNKPSTFRLTYLPDRDCNTPSNEWARVSEDEIRAWKKSVQTARKARQKKQIPDSPSCTTVTHLRAVPTSFKKTTR